MKIALLGYGRMGKEIEKLARHRGHEVTTVLQRGDSVELLAHQNIDTAIDFSSPNSAFDNIISCISMGIPIVSGTTGWTDRLSEAIDYCREKKGSFIYASNFSIGVNLFFSINKKLAAIMSRYPEYALSLKETHHTGKKDAPSGTALTLYKQINEEFLRNEVKPPEVSIQSERLNHVPGTHEIAYSSEVDSIEITHTAHNRSGFALGAILASEWLVERIGYYTMDEVLDL